MIFSIKRGIIFIEIQMFKNIKANFIAQFVLIFSTFYSLPQLLKILGPDAYALVGLYFSVQGVFMLIDLGLGAGIIKICSSNNSYTNKLDLKLSRYLNTSEFTYVIISLIGLLLLLLSKQYIITDWKQSNTTIDIDYCYLLMAISISLRLMSNQYKSILSGFEKQTLLSTLNAIFNFFRYIVIIVVLLYINNSIEQYFTYQLILSVLELFVFMLFFKKKYKKSHTETYISTISFSAIKEMLTFSSKVALISVLWIILLQFDKIILTRVLSMEKFGYYTITTTLSVGLVYLNSPISAAILPRLSNIFVSSDFNKFEKTYFFASKLIILLILPVALLLIFLPDHILYFWTGNIEMVNYSFVVKYYSLFILSILVLGIPFMHSFAVNNLKVNLKWNIVLVLTIVPLFYFLVANKSLVLSLKIISSFTLFFSLIFLTYYNYIYFKSINWLKKVLIQPLLMFIPGVILIYSTSFNIESRLLSFLIISGAYGVIIFPYLIFFRKEIIDEITLLR